MTELQTPMKKLLRRTTTPASVERMWSRIDARARIAPAARRGGALARPQWLLVAAILVCVSGVALAATWSAVRRTRDASSQLETTSRDGVLAPSTPTGGAGRLAAPPKVDPPDVAPSHVASSVTERTAEAEPRPASAVPSPTAAQSVAPSERPRWRDLAAQGDDARAYTELGRQGIASAARTASVDDLFALADVARLSGHPGEAVVPLTRLVAEYPSDPRAPLASLTLGRVQLKSLGAPGPAARSLERAIALGIPAGLAEDAYALWVEACTKSGDSAGARRAYAAYVARFPNGSRGAELRDMVGGP